MILYILKLFFKPITTFEKYNDNLDDSKNCIFLTILILILMTLGYLFVKAADCVVTYPVWDYGYTLKWKNLFEFSWGYYICKGLVISLIALFSITTTIFAMSRFFNRNVRYLKLLAIVSSSFLHFTIGVMCIGNLLRYDFEWLSLVMFIVSTSLTLLILYEFINIELALTDNQKIYFNVICLFILVSMLCYVFVKCINPSSVNIIPDFVG